MFMHTHRALSLQRGVTLLEMMGVVAIMGSVTLGAVSLSNLYASAMQASAAGKDLTTFALAVRAYVLDNSGTILTSGGPVSARLTVPVLTTVTVSNPTGTKYLPSGFPLRNSYGQFYCAVVGPTAPTADITGRAAIVFTEGGSVIGNVDLAQIAAVVSAAGISGGANYSGGMGTRGTMGGWTGLPNISVTTSFTKCDGTGGAYPTPGAAGHPVAVMSFDAEDNPGAAGGPVLRNRAGMYGQQFSTVNANLGLNGNDITNGGAIGATSINATDVTTAKAAIGSIQLTDVVVEGAPCTTTDKVSRTLEGKVVSCVNGYWGGGSGVQGDLTRITFAHNDSFSSPTVYSWPVPVNVRTIFVSAAGGGGTAQGWRLTSTLATGHSGGFVQNYPLDVIPGEVLSISVGAAGALGAYTPVCDDPVGAPVAVTLAPGAEGTGEIVGFKGGATTITSDKRPLILQCGGGAGAGPGYNGVPAVPFYMLANTDPVPNASYGYDDIGPVSVGGSVLVGQSIGGGGAAVAAYNAAGTCGVQGASSFDIVGRGVNGAKALYAPGSIAGGASPLGSGSGGGVSTTEALNVWAVPPTKGRCIQANPAQSGVVTIDYHN